MTSLPVKKKLPKSESFRVYKLTKAGHTRYLNIGTILPLDWVAVKVVIVRQDNDVAILKLERIK